MNIGRALIAIYSCMANDYIFCIAIATCDIQYEWNVDQQADYVQ